MSAYLLAAASLWTWWIEPCEKPETTGCLVGDADLASWALDAWARASAGALKFSRVKDEKLARVRIYWAGTRPGLYGEARPIEVNGQRGAEIYVRPTLDSAADPLLRDVFVYLTLLHEAGHGIGLSHTANFVDIMYSFQYGGDLDEYFARSRRKVKIRADIARLDAVSPADAVRLQRILAYLKEF